MKVNIILGGKNGYGKIIITIIDLFIMLETIDAKRKKN